MAASSGAPLDPRDYSEVKDSGERQEFETGSRRDTRCGKGRYDLIPAYPMYRLARHFENGAVKYGDRNWEKGQPLSRYLDSCMRHLWKVINGDNDEDHEAAVAWNIFAYMHTLNVINEGTLPESLDDLGRSSRKAATWDGSLKTTQPQFRPDMK